MYKFIFCAVLCLRLALPQDAEALSAQFQVGFGDDSGFDQADISYIRTDLNLFFHESDLFDMFVGGEYAESEHQTSCFLFCTGVINSSYEYEAATVGVHVKPFKKGRVNPYLALGAVWGRVEYSATGDYAAVVLSLPREKDTFTMYRAGVGVTVAITRKLAVEAELMYSSGVPVAYALVERSGRTEEETIFDGSPIINFGVGVRYYF